MNILFVKLDMYKGGSNLQIDVPPYSQVCVLMRQNQFLAALAALHLTLVSDWVTATLEF